MNEKKLQIPAIPGVSLVAYYGKKPLVLQQLIINLQQLLHKHFKNSFIPYELNRVHATIIGCEGMETKLGIVNKWFYDLRNELRYIDYSQLLNFLSDTNLLPLDISFGGYNPDFNYHFLSRNQHPSDRSFQLQRSQISTLIPIVIGWSLTNCTIDLHLNDLRRQLQDFNLLHKYHKSPQDIDNDLYLRLGTITGNFNLEVVSIVRQEINSYLQNLTSVKVALSQANLAIVKYQDVTLPINSTKIYSLLDLKAKPHLIKQLYQ